MVAKKAKPKKAGKAAKPAKDAVSEAKKDIAEQAAETGEQAKEEMMEKAADKTSTKAKEKGLDKKQRMEILKTFTKEVLKKYGPVIRSIVLFGSTARGSEKLESDLDVFIIVDDTKVKITPAARHEMEDFFDATAKKLHSQFSVQPPHMLTEFWGMVRDGHPIVFNFIREGIPVYDKDIFLPIKRLLQMGEIRPSKEAVEKFIERGPKRIKRVENAKMYMVVEDCYYAMLESAQAVLMFLGKIPPRPNEAPSVLEKTLVEMKMLEPKYVKYLNDIIEVRKGVEHKNIKKISGAELDEWIKKTEEFVKKMQKLIVKIEVLKREGIVEKSHAIMTETALTLLKSMDKLPKTRDSLPKAFEDNLVKTGMIDSRYLDVFNELEKMKKLVESGKIMDLPKQHILMHREYVRRFIREAGRVMKKKVNPDSRFSEE